MPYKCEQKKLIKLQGTSNDRRRRLTDEQKDEIVSLRGKMSQRECARMFNVSRRTIMFLWNPESHQRNLQRRQERGGSKIYYDKEKHKEHMKNHRHYKQAIYLEQQKREVNS